MLRSDPFYAQRDGFFIDVPFLRVPACAFDKCVAQRLGENIRAEAGEDFLDFRASLVGEDDVVADLKTRLSLTGQLNRAAFQERLQALAMQDSGVGLVVLFFFDLNRFKEVNDTLGHDDGDELLKTIVKVIRESVRANDVIARLGGDEFLIVFDGIGAERAEEVWLNRVVNSFARINETEGRRYLVSASHGIEAVDYSSGEPLDAVVNRADEKMYAEKREIKKGLKIISCC